MSFSFFFLKHQDEESGSDSEFRPRRTSFEDKVKIAEKKQETIPETVSEKKGVGFAVETPEENNKEAVEEVSPYLKISILITWFHTFLLTFVLRIWCYIKTVFLVDDFSILITCVLHNNYIDTVRINKGCTE